MDPCSSLVTALQLALPFLVESGIRNSEACIRQRVYLGRISRRANEAFPGSACAVEWRVMENDRLWEAQMGLMMFDELQRDFEHGNE